MRVATIDRNAVFEKTAQGRAEIRRRMAGLGAVDRQVLIVIDGRKNIDAMAALFPSSDIAGVAATLWREGFIDLVRENDRVVVEAPPPRPAVHPDGHAASAPFHKAIGAVPAEAHLSYVELASGTGHVDLHPNLLGQTQDVMAASARACIGLLADKLIDRIEAAQSLDELADVAGQWHMALRESKRGRPVADELLDKVRHLINQG